ncbi:MAG TPA: hypothetical protein VMY87_05220 [Armatimonadota bacterium]|nr:hypothetical protein [Armatimonadota bacterium]
MGRIGVVIVLLGTLALADQAAAQTVLLVHDAGAAPMPAERRAISSARELLGHFEATITVISAHEYRAHLLAGYDAVVYLGLREGAELPDAFLADCYDLDRPLCWLGANLGQLAQRFSLGRYGFDVADPPAEAAPTRVIYRGMPYWREQAPLRRITVTQSQVCDTIAAVDDHGERLPYAVRSGNLWYFAEIPLESTHKGGTYLILCDQMHQLLSREHAGVRTALLCIAGVTPDTDAGKLTTLIRQLHSEGVPFAIEVGPLLVGAPPAQLLRLSRKRGLIGVLRGAQQTGASIIATPPARSHDAADGSEGGPHHEPTQPPLDLLRRTEQALQELSHCGLYPIALGMPPDLRGEDRAAAVSDMCSTLLETDAADSDEADTPALPFLTRRGHSGPRVMPHNLPTLKEGRGEVEAILESARRQATVPDPFITVPLAPGAPQKALALLLNGLRNMDYQFTDLRHTANRTKAKSLQIQTVDSRRLLMDLLPEGWDATLIAPDMDSQLHLDQSDDDRKEETLVHPGTILVSYPPGQRPKIIFSFEGDAQQVTQKMVRRVAQLVVLFALAASAVLLLIYVFQAAQRRRM